MELRVDKDTIRLHVYFNRKPFILFLNVMDSVEIFVTPQIPFSESYPGECHLVQTSPFFVNFIYESCRNCSLFVFDTRTSTYQKDVHTSLFSKTKTCLKSSLSLCKKKNTGQVDSVT